MNCWTNRVLMSVAVAGAGLMLAGCAVSATAETSAPAPAGETSTALAETAPTVVETTSAPSTAVVDSTSVIDELGTLVVTGPNGELLEVFWPKAGDVVTNPLAYAGATTGGAMQVRLIGAGGVVLGETTMVPDGAGELTFSSTLTFTNDCCTEMTLEITSSDGLVATVPLNYG